MEMRGAKAGFVPVSLPAGPFTLAGFLKDQSADSTLLVVYLEGDGRIVVGNRPSKDPSPHAAQGFALALLDPAPQVLYLARIGQYQPQNAGERFQKYWLEQRLADEAVVAASQAIDQIKSKVGARKIQLIGYSGGGGLAALVAARRDDVVSLVTVAGLLDHRWWTSKLDVPPLAGSLNPIDFTEPLSGLAQVHFYGTSDRIIAPEISARFVGRFASPQVIRVGVDSDHWNNWTDAWPALLQEYVLPRR